MTDDRVYNLSLYLDYVRQAAPELWGAMMDEFDGMPGFGNDARFVPDYREADDDLDT